MVAVSKKYPKAPIVEAVIDIHARFSEDILEKLPRFAESFKKDFPDQQKISFNTVNFNISDKGIPDVSPPQKEDIGYRLSSPDSPFVLQFRKNGFSFSIVNTYQDWEVFCKTAKKYWESFIRELKPNKVTRVAVRYINRIDIPALNFEVEDYFEFYPRVFEDKKTKISNFLMQVHLPQDEGGMAVINQALTEPPQPGYTSTILDIDVFAFIDCAPDDKKCWERIELLRHQKNSLFEKSLTPKTKELFE